MAAQPQAQPRHCPTTRVAAIKMNSWTAKVGGSMTATIMLKKDACPRTRREAGSSMRTKEPRKTSMARSRSLRARHFARPWASRTNEGGSSYRGEGPNVGKRAAGQGSRYIFRHAAFKQLCTSVQGICARGESRQGQHEERDAPFTGPAKSEGSFERQADGLCSFSGPLCPPSPLAAAFSLISTPRVAGKR